MPFDSNLRLQSSLVGESVTGVFLLQEVGDNMYKQYRIYSCLAQYMGILQPPTT